ncbi:conserved hypothetical protein [Xenorhabdus nematophila F1]|uniref:Uncharacterized protein n=1 Tax=Xenorhabdus nematophila (strain ATCC 19061 / DSM 3370 / CCUG 14189 / LMG 1036 / NCIMB 9965 / AN6) TaxID=406817 RepID=D3VGR9_XENNA|nr:conserved hypothetical protein [Xenorhabdus nematophila ATCC 19061]CCW32530.1 conserved hypothetical protein [Xenorhabdus nematophila F1]
MLSLIIFMVLFFLWNLLFSINVIFNDYFHVAYIKVSMKNFI